MIIKIDRRLPFGFKGNWSKCYKKTNYNEKQEIKDLRGTTWLFKDVINNFLEGGLINFTSNNTNYLGISSTTKKFYYVTGAGISGFTTVYDKDNGGWQNENYKLITISKTQTDDYYKNQDFITWIKQNATLLNKQIIEYSRTTYYDIGFDVQLKHIEDGVDKSIINSQPIQNLVTKGGYIIVKTTDAHLNDKRQFECIISVNDIVLFENEYWIVEKVDERSVYTPSKQTIYYLVMKNVFNDVIVGINRSKVDV